MRTLQTHQQALKLLNDDGWISAYAECSCQHPPMKRDLFGMFDLVAIKGTVTLAVQVTTYSNLSARVKKMSGCEWLRGILVAWQVEAWGMDEGHIRLARTFVPKGQGVEVLPVSVAFPETSLQ